MGTIFDLKIPKTFCQTHLGEIMTKGANHAKVKVISKDYIFHVANFLLVYIAFFTFKK
jgi:hypothetical protein